MFKSIDTFQKIFRLDVMISDQEAAKILKKNRIIFDPKMKATQFSGAAPFLAFLKKGKIRS